MGDVVINPAEPVPRSSRSHTRKCLSQYKDKERRKCKNLSEIKCLITWRGKCVAKNSEAGD